MFLNYGLIVDEFYPLSRVSDSWYQFGKTTHEHVKEDRFLKKWKREQVIMRLSYGQIAFRN